MKKTNNPGDTLEDMFKARRTRAKKSPHLKMRKSVICCKHKKTPQNQRAKFGTCSCDSYSMSHTLAIVISNYLYQYLADAKGFIVRDDWDILEECAEHIREYADLDSWNICSKEKGVKSKYLKKERDFKKSMKYLIDNWKSLWW